MSLGEAMLYRNQMQMERLEDRQTYMEFCHFPRRGPQRIEAISRWIDHQCRVQADRKPPALESVWLEAANATGDERSYPIQAMILPENERRSSRRGSLWGYDDYSSRAYRVLDDRDRARAERKPYFTTFGQCDSPVRERDIPELEQRLQRRLREENSPGSIEVRSRKVRIRLGRRRPQKVSETEICKALFLEERKPNREAWSHARTKPAVYKDIVSPQFRDQSTQPKTPFDWATKGVCIVNGLSQTLVGQDYPLLAAEVPYKRVAGLACNRHPKRNSQRILFERTEKVDALLHRLGPDPLPEAVYLVLALQDHLIPELVGLRPLRTFLEKLPTYLENGLCVDRVVDLVHELKGPSPARRGEMIHALKITDSVFGSKERPWWFHEDQSFVPENRSTSWGSSENRKAHKLLAEKCGPIYQYAKEVWEMSGVELTKFQGMTLENAVDLVASVTRDYGIGNVERANNVLKFSRATLGETREEEREQTCSKLLETFHAHKPRSEIIGALEGSDTDFEKPGLVGIAHNLLEQIDTGKRGLYTLTFQPQHVRKAIQATAKPLEERAKIAPVTALPHVPEHRFITHVGNAGVLALPVPKEYRMVGTTERPLLTWVDFDKQLRSEVPPYKQTDVAKLYLTFFAHKMPEPFNPPEGFLSIMERLSNIHDPGFQHSIMSHPYDREAKDEENAAAKIDRWALLGSWLDTAVLGLQSYDQVVDTFLWVLLDQGNPLGEPATTSPERREKQIEGHWDKYWSDKKYREYIAQDRWGEHDAYLRGKQGLFEKFELFCLECAHDEDVDPHVYTILEWARDNLDVIHERRLNVGDDWERAATGEGVKFDHNSIKARLDEAEAERDFLYKMRRFFSRRRSSGENIGGEDALDEWAEKRIKRLWDKQKDIRRSEESSWEYSFYDPMDIEEDELDDEPRAAVVEESEEEHRQYEDHEWSQIGDGLIDNEVVERFQQLGHTMEFLTCLNGLIASGTFPPQVFSASLQQTVIGLKAGTVRFKESPRKVLEDLHNTAETLKEIKDHKLADTEKVEAALANFSNPADLIEILSDISSLVSPYHEVKQRIAQELKQGARFHSSETYDVYIKDSLTEQIKEVLNAGSPYFVENAAEIMLDDFFWLERYGIVTPHLTSFLKTLPGTSKKSDDYSDSWTEIQPTLDTAFRTISAAWMFRAASEVFVAEGRSAFELTANRENVSQLLAAGSGEPMLISPSGVAGNAQVAQEVGHVLTSGKLPASHQGVDLISRSGSDEKIIPFHVTHGLDQQFKRFKEKVIECRRRDFGLLATGGKVHVIHKIDSYRLNFLRSRFNFDHTTFMVDNAEHMVLLSPTSSATEIQQTAEFLNAESIIDWEFPEIQMCMAGQTNVGNCAILGSSIMAVTDVNVPYNEDSFDTSHEHSTAFRIMIYDAGGPRNKFPFDVTRTGRVDMLGRRSLGDFGPWQLLGSTLSYSEEPLDGSNKTITVEHLEEFHRLAAEYKSSFKSLLRHNGLHSVLAELWLNPIYLDTQDQRSNDSENPRFDAGKKGGRQHFRNAVAPMMKAWDACADEAEITGKMGGVVGGAKDLFRTLGNGVRSIQQDMLQSKDYAKHRDLLFRLDD